jgi:hypothetical protein
VEKSNKRTKTNGAREWWVMWTRVLLIKKEEQERTGREEPSGWEYEENPSLFQIILQNIPLPYRDLRFPLSVF